ncbi:UvrD-helicase domain-containing protein [Neptunomonas qingdaonensis]|uniref:DNA helicase-2 / ATP-dependent DNA helicase PcrA n=1 Tax=Neptunomonas qingdaonensis TaxID=1045558 RepID=A0A1I2P9R4_9GAMM|nr:UvrD-helicase domain-containing protein [Neptunomonas qingdaonensis]SFG10376.1 DNA helicase-2 / ATP-dependent DNA helicase PcrA [Neptunomonas qingdaonensis]
MTPNEIVELDIQKSINKHIDDFNSFRFNAGAGAGKTYALIETLKYVTINKIAATKSPQKVACITYTNVAVNEIKTRLGNSDAVQVSTIHERLWDIIQRAQPQLLICHREKIVAVIKQHSQKLDDADNKKTKFFAGLNDEQKQIFIEFAMQTKDLFYQSKKLSAKFFKEAYTNRIAIQKSDFLANCIKNIDNFKQVVVLLYKKKRLEDCLERIDAGIERRVNYDSKVNSDRLHYMKFSHDTLLEYGLKLVVTYPTLCRIIIDSYPYFFIDEYQDTHSNVVKFVKTIHDYAIENNKNWVVGYFGDTAQSIYDDGVGRNIASLHDRLVDVDKILNRRSHKQIIDVANKIRADEIVQEPIFEERNNGSVHFFYNSSEDKLTTAQQFLTEYKNDLIKDNGESGETDGEKTKIHCLVLTNKLMANFNRFGNVYEVYQKSTIYFDNLNTQVLSQQLEKLHSTVLSIYHLVKLYQDIKQSVVSYYGIFGASSKNIAFSKASLVIRELKNNEVVSLKDWVDLIIDRLENSDAKDVLGKALTNRVNYEPDKVISADVFQSTLLDNINTLMNEDSENEITAKEKVDSVLALPIISLINWSNFIDGIETDEISYHTYHGTKGEEYKNVAIILEHSFGRMNKDKFKNYFKIVQQSAEERERLLTVPDTKEKHINTQNLLYVACSRAIKNLRVLYLDDISEVENGINAIFGESKLWPIDGNQSSV